MADFVSLALDCVKDLVTRGLQFNSSRDAVKADVECLDPLVSNTIKCLEQVQAHLPTAHQLANLGKLKNLLAKTNEALEKCEIRWWNCLLAPLYQRELEERGADLQKFVSVPTLMNMYELLAVFILKSQDRPLSYPIDMPTFTVTELTLDRLHLSSSPYNLDCRFQISVTARNPNRDIVFNYERTSISILFDDVSIGHRTKLSWERGKNNTEILNATFSSGKQPVKGESAAKLKSRVKYKRRLPLKVNLEMKVTGKMGFLKMHEIRIRESFDGIKVTYLSGKKQWALPPIAECKVDVGCKPCEWTVR